jgi:ferredoxin
MSEHQLGVDWPACKAHGLCAELLPELISLDEWGYPIVLDLVGGDLSAMAKRTLKACPTLALRLTQLPARHT